MRAGSAAPVGRPGVAVCSGERPLLFSVAASPGPEGTDALAVFGHDNGSGPGSRTGHGAVADDRSPTSNTVGSDTVASSAEIAVSTTRLRYSSSSAISSSGSPKGWVTAVPCTMRSTPTDSARGTSAVTSAAGIPWFSIDLASVDPLRVPVPQVERRRSRPAPRRRSGRVPSRRRCGSCRAGMPILPVVLSSSIVKAQPAVLPPAIGRRPSGTWRSGSLVGEAGVDTTMHRFELPLREAVPACPGSGIFSPVGRPSRWQPVGVARPGPSPPRSPVPTGRRRSARDRLGCFSGLVAGGAATPSAKGVPAHLRYQHVDRPGGTPQVFERTLRRRPLGKGAFLRGRCRALHLVPACDARCARRSSAVAHAGGCLGWWRRIGTHARYSSAPGLSAWSRCDRRYTPRCSITAATNGAAGQARTVPIRRPVRPPRHPDRDRDINPMTSSTADGSSPCAM